MFLILLPSRVLKPSAGGATYDFATAEWQGAVFNARSSTGVVCALARLLIAAGCPDQPWQATRNGIVVMLGKSLASVANLTVSEPDTGPGPRFAKYKPGQFWAAPTT